MWRTAKGGRDAKLVRGVGGGPLAWCAGLRTTFTLASEKKKDGSPLSAPLEQLVVGPLSIPPVAPRFGVGEPGFALQRVGTMGKLNFVHERRAERHYIVLELTTERAVSYEGDGSWEVIGSCDAYAWCLKFLQLTPETVLSV